MIPLIRPDNEPKNILFVHYGDEWIRGSERCLIDLLINMDKSRFRPVLWCNSEILADYVESLGITVYVSKFPVLFGWNKPRFNLMGYRKLIRHGQAITDKHNIDLIHANSGAPSQWLNVVARNRSKPLLIHLHSRYQLRDRISLGLHHASKVVGVSKPIVDQLLEDGLISECCRVIPNGIDTRRLASQPTVSLRKSLKLSSDDFIIVTTASLIHRKGVDLLIDACQLLRNLQIPAQLVVIGDGPLRGELEAYAENRGVGEHVHFLGEQANVAGRLRDCDIFVSGAREEVFGLVLAEAAFCGLPVVAPRVGGIPSVIEHNHTGILTPPECAHSIAQAVFHFYVNPLQRKEFIDAGYKAVMEKFSIETYVERFEDLYSSMLEDPSEPLTWLSHWQFKATFTPVLDKIFHRAEAGQQTETVS